MIRFKGMNHIALTVADLQRSVRFYRAAFRMRHFGPERPGSDFVPLVSSDLGMQISLSNSRNLGESGRNPGRPGEQGGIDHFGFTVSPGTNLEALRQRLTECGATYLRRIDIGNRAPSLFFADPDGYVFQITRLPRFTRWYIALLPLLKNLQRLP